MTDIKLLTMKDVTEKMGVARGNIYKMMREQAFPLPIQLSPRRIAWIESEIDDWIHKRFVEAKKRRDKAKSKIKGKSKT